MFRFKRMLLLIFFLSILLPIFPSRADTISVSILYFSTQYKTIQEGEGFGITAYYAPANTTDTNNTWYSSNPSVATVSSGWVIAKSAGTAVITLQKGSLTANCSVTVTPAPRKFKNAKSVYKYTNKQRRKHKRKKLKQNAKLEKYAKKRAKEIAIKYSHTRPNNKPGVSIIRGNKWKGENIAYGQKTGKIVCTAWYKSKKHRKNVLNKHFKKMGAACYSYKGVNYWVQLFSS